MRIALYQGKTFFPSRCIRWLTRSPYSHAAFVFDLGASRAAREMMPGNMSHREVGAVIEAWEPGGVRNTASLSAGHTPGTPVDIFSFRNPLTIDEEKRLLLFLHQQIGKRYNFRAVLGFVTRRDFTLDGSWFCSELCFEGARLVNRNLFEQTEAWEVPPGWIQRSTILKLERSIVTV